MSRGFKTLLLMVVFALAACGVAGAVPNLLNYQGRLGDASGNPVNGANSIVFSIYSVGTGGSALWTETQSVTVTNGLFNVLLGSVTAFPSTLFGGGNLFLGIKVGSDPEMTPRQQLASVGYAQRAGAADIAPGIAMSATSSGGGTNSITTTAVIDSVDITIPAPGIIAVDAGGESYISHSTGALSFYSYGVDEARFVIPSSSGGGSTQVFYYGALPTQSYDDGISLRRLYSKPSAGTYRFYFNTRFNSGASSSGSVQYAWISATYFPAAFGSISAPQAIVHRARPNDGVNPEPTLAR